MILKLLFKNVYSKIHSPEKLREKTKAVTQPINEESAITVCNFTKQ